MNSSITLTPLWIPVVADGKTIIRGERVMCDGQLAEIVAWNDLPTFFVRINKTKKLMEVEPWRIRKIEKVTDSSTL